MSQLLQSYGLTQTTVCWEDTARTKGSCYGPNISDMTLISNDKLCNVIRRPNFADVTVDHSIDNFMVTVGNENDTPLLRISLSEYIKSLSIDVTENEKILCSTQACILNDQSKDVSFNVRLFNYQTTTENPAVLVVVATNQGTSSLILDSKTTDVLFNKNCTSYDFVAERLKDERKRLNRLTDEPMTTEEKERNVIYVYQIPLVVPRNVRKNSSTFGGKKKGGICNYENEMMSCLEDGSGLFDRCHNSVKIKTNISKGFDNAMLKVGSIPKGPFLGTRGKTLTRDTNYPIRCTLQYYWVTDTDIMSETLIQTMAAQLEKFYSNSENKSSLVLSNTTRPTEPKSNSDLPNPTFAQPMNMYA